MSSRSDRRRRRRHHLALALTAAIALAGCADAVRSTPSPSGRSSDSMSAVALPPAGGRLDYQLGGAYPPAGPVQTVVRDRAARPDPGRYSVCYVNAFQTQPGDRELWPDDTLLRRDGRVVTDPDWPDEVLLDTSSEARRGRIAAVLVPWVERCADDGYDAVELDNLDSYTRSGGALERQDNVALARRLVDAAHAKGLAAGQKNAAEDSEVLREGAGFDFAVVEECAAYRECPTYEQVYGDRVLDIEYTDNLPRTFAAMCADEASPRSMVLRDRDLEPAGSPGHVARVCP
ncbi:endo alpha-1,4 polygalactosaminidase [Janibacter melonis]|uniref:endo alpha-1,4 polygalactosaminidase n=1 Tax=Janibacter melonis TaxID=262209 RepID=UPI00174EAD33|nr:endo alpha-1,4 polygalactosaminidase [Janibacter melonis]